MKQFCVGFLVGVLLTMVPVGVLLFPGLRVGFGGSGRKGHGLPFEHVEESGGLRIALGSSNSNAVVISRGSDSFTLVPPAGESYDEPIATPDGRSLFFLVRKELDFGYNFGGVLRVDFTTNVLSSNKLSRILSPPQVEKLLGTNYGVTELFQTSPTGDQLLVNVFRSKEWIGPAGKTTYARRSPYWYDIKNNTLREPTP